MTSHHRDSRPPTDGEIESLRRQLAAAVHRHAPPWLRGETDDLVQVALMRVLDASASGEGIRPVRSSYLWRAAYSVVVDEIRRRRRRREVPLEETAENDVRVPAADPERSAAARGVGDGIRSCLRSLSPDRRVAVTLHLQGHTVPEIAELLGWKPKRADNLVYRGLAALRQCLAGKGIEP